MKSNSALGLFAGAALFAMAAHGAAAAPSIDTGRALAVEACTACHQVTLEQKRPPAVAEGEEGAHVLAPTFVAIARKCLTAAELRAKIANPHYPMREQFADPGNLDALATYIQSLDRGRTCAPH